MVENLLSKMYIEGALMSKSRNIALIVVLGLTISPLKCARTTTDLAGL